MSRRTKYTPGEDRDLFAFVEANKNRYPVTGNKLWIFAEAQRITNHSWQSMKARYQLLSGASAKKGKKKPWWSQTLKSSTQATIPFASSPSTSTSTRPTSTRRSSAYHTSTHPTSTSTSQRRPTKTDATTQTDGTEMVSVGVGFHLFCPVAHYRPVDVGTQTVCLPSQHRRSRSF